jgi:hypothetical protein
VLAHHGAAPEVDTQRLDLLELGTHHVFLEAVLGNAIHQHPARLFLTLEDGDAEPLPCQVAGHGEPGRTRADDGYLAPRLLGQSLAHQLHLGVEVGDETLDLANLYALAFLGQHAVSLALLLVRTHASADGGQVAALVDDAHGRPNVAHGELVYELRNIVVDGAPLAAQRHLAMQAALGLVDGLASGEPLVGRQEDAPQNLGV